MGRSQKIRAFGNVAVGATRCQDTWRAKAGDEPVDQRRPPDGTLAHAFARIERSERERPVIDPGNARCLKPHMIIAKSGIEWIIEHAKPQLDKPRDRPGIPRRRRKPDIDPPRCPIDPEHRELYRGCTLPALGQSLCQTFGQRPACRLDRIRRQNRFSKSVFDHGRRDGLTRIDRLVEKPARFIKPPQHKIAEARREGLVWARHQITQGFQANPIEP